MQSVQRQDRVHQSHYTPAAMYEYTFTLKHCLRSGAILSTYKIQAKTKELAMDQLKQCQWDHPVEPIGYICTKIGASNDTN